MSHSACRKVRFKLAKRFFQAENIYKSEDEIINKNGPVPKIEVAFSLTSTFASINFFALTQDSNPCTPTGTHWKKLGFTSRPTSI